MASILSPEELKALLPSPRSLLREGEAGDARHGDEPVPYDFRRPDRVSKEQVRSIHLLHDRFARELSTSLSAYLRIGTEVALVRVEAFNYAEFLMSLPDPTVFCSLSLAPIESLGALELNPNVAFAMIDRMLGGRVAPSPTSRALTEIEQNVVDGVLGLILEDLGTAWRRILDIQFRIHARETRPQILPVAAPGDAMVLVVFDLHVGETTGTLNLCLPAALCAGVPQGWQSARRDPSPLESRHLARNLGRVSVPLTAVLRTRLAAGDILALRPGDLVSLGRPVRAPIEVRAWNTPKLLVLPTRTANGLGLAVHSWVGAAEDEATR